MIDSQPTIARSSELAYKTYGFCPDCSAPLDAESSTNCWNCLSIYDGINPNHLPTVFPTRKFKLYHPGIEKMNPTRKESIKASKEEKIVPFPSSKLGIFFSRLLLGFAVWLGIGFLALVSAIPYGGGSKPLLALLQAATFICPLFALAIFFENPREIPETVKNHLKS